METEKVSKKLLQRLPIYLVYLKSLDCSHISATALASALGLGHVQVRKDLAKVSDGGRCKTGHQRERLIRDIETFLTFHSVANAIVVGMDSFGQALLDYGVFGENGLEILAGFDVGSDLRRTKAGKPIYPMNNLETFCARNFVRVGILTVPADNAQMVCDRLVAGGVEAIWNFTPVQLTVPEKILVRNENLSLSLAALQVHLNCRSTEVVVGS